MLSKLKNHFKKILPLPASYQLEQNKKVNTSISMFQNELRKLSANVEILTELQKTNIGQLNDLEKSISPASDKILYTRAAEAGLIKRFLEYRKNVDFASVFLKLAENLDPVSLSALASMHHRMDAVGKDSHLLEKYEFDFYTKEEQQILRLQNEQLSERFKLSDDCFIMGQYMLPVNMFYREIFFDYMGENKIKNLSAIKQKHIVDAGAFCGDSLVMFSDWTEKEVHCFEASAINADLFEKTVAMNGIKNGLLNRVALGAERGILKFRHLGSGGSSRFATDNEQHLPAESVPVVALDDYVDEHKLEVGLIKVDIEGAEQLFIKGAEKTLRSQKPTLLMSIYHNPDDFYNIKPILENLNLGYNFQIHKPVSDSILAGTTLIAQI